MIHMIVLFIVKIIDNIIMTAKSIALINNKELLSSILVTISQIMFYLLVKEVVEDSTITAIVLISIASGIGNYLAIKINNKYKKDVMWMNILTCSDKQSITALCDVCKEHGIKFIVNDCYTPHSWKETYSVLVFSTTKAQSKAIDDFLSTTDVKYLRQIIKN